MILEQLTLHNFCLYRGKQTFELAPCQRNQPVVLVGGLNGGGKTTILDAVQLALYGSRAQLSKRDGSSYENFLRECINRGVDAKDGASVALTFQYVSEGQQNTYEVRRSWAEKTTTVREMVSVYKDGEHDRHLSDHWNEIVEELIPLGISRLFFFDAEQVRFLADDGTSNKTLGSAVKSLLGLDLAEKLIADASILESRLAERIAKVSNDPEYPKLLKELGEKDLVYQAKKQERASIENERLRAELELTKAEALFEEAGGKHWIERESRKRELSQTKESEKQTRGDLVRHAATALPFALVPGLVDRIAKQDEAEQISREAVIVHKVLAQRDKEILKSLKAEGVDTTLLSAVDRVQKSDRDNREKAAGEGVRHGLSEDARAAVHQFQNGSLNAELATVRELLTRFEKARKKREQLDRSLKMTPDDVSILDVFDALKTATEREAVINGKAKRLDDELNSLRFHRDEVDRKLKDLQRSHVDGEIDAEEAARMAKLAGRTQDIMKEFLKRSTAQKIDRLSRYVSDAFQFLLRKQALIERVEIDPESFQITLYDTDGNVLPKERLSEGEKQIFAVSVLWGLAKASPRPLPAIIDTPMASLDTEHRAHLVERYFPHASHQVIILSTDAEIDAASYESIRPQVSHAFHLKYDEAEKSTVAESGYFPSFNEELLEVAQ